MINRSIQRIPDAISYTVRVAYIASTYLIFFKRQVYDFREWDSQLDTYLAVFETVTSSIYTVS